MTPPLLEEFFEQLSKVKRKPSVLAYDLICFCPLKVYLKFWNISKTHPTQVVYNPEYSYSPLRIAGVSVISAGHMTSPNFKFAQMISVCANGKCGV